MKRVFLYLVMMLMGVLAFAQETITVSANSEDISQNLDLKVVAKLFAEASTTEEFEIMLNNPDSAYSNLDLNGDNQIDYLRVVETGFRKSRLIVIQAVLAKDIYQDVASIYVEKDEQEQVSVQIIGDEYVYGTNYIIEPVYIYRPIIYDWLWDIRWYCWYSPYYWGYYPYWWRYHSCYTYHWYWNRCHRFHHHHYHCSFHHGYQLNHRYYTMHSGVTRREYANIHPDNSFNRRHTEYRNASELKRTGVSYRGGSVRQHNFNNRTYDSKNIVSSRSINSQTQRTSVNTTQRSENTQRSGNTQSSSRTQQTTRTVNTNNRTSTPARTSQTTSTQRTSTTRTSSTPVRQSTSTQSTYRSNGSSSRTSGSYSGSRNRGSSGSRSSGSVPRSGGGSRGSVRR